MDEPVVQVVYELWSDEDMRWVEVGSVDDPQVQLFLEAWTSREGRLFRKRPRYTHPDDVPF